MAGVDDHRGANPIIAVIGVGRWGANIVRDLVVLGADVIAVDPDPAARTRAIELGAVDSRAALSGAPDVDGVVIATPASSHERDVLEAGRLGVPIACEKPLTASSVSARAVVEAVGGRLTVLHVWRYHPGVELLGRLARSGSLGSVNALRTVRANWTSPRCDVDPMWTFLPHDLSIAVEIFGCVPEPVHATVERIDGRVVSIWAAFGPPDVLVEATTRSGERRRDIRVHGSDAVAVLSDGAEHVEVLTGAALTPDVERIAFDPTPALQREMGAFVEHIRGGPAPKTNAAEGLAVVDAVERALALGRPTPGGNGR